MTRFLVERAPGVLEAARPHSLPRRLARRVRAAAGLPVWNGDLSTGDLTQWGAAEYFGTFTPGHSVSERIRVGATLDGYSPPPGCSNLMCFEVHPGDKYGGSTGERALLRQYEPIRTVGEGHDSWFVWWQLVPTGYPADTDMWVFPLEWHQTLAPYVQVTGPAPGNALAETAGLKLDVKGGRDGNWVQPLKQIYTDGYKAGVGQIYALRVRHSAIGDGAVELWHSPGGRAVQPLVQLSGIKTMYEQTQSHFLMGAYRNDGAASVTRCYAAGFREYASQQDALAWAATLAGTGQPTTTGLNVRKVAETAKTVTIAHDTPAGVEAYELTVDGNPVLPDGKRHFYFDGTVQRRIGKVLDGKPHRYGVRALTVADSDDVAV